MSDPYEKSPRQVDEPQENFSVSDLVALLSVASDKEIGEFNEIFDNFEKEKSRADKAEAENAELKEKLDKIFGENDELVSAYRKMESSVDTIMANANKHLQYAEQAKREKAQMQDKITKLEMQVAPYKVLGTVKKIREQIKAYKDNAATNQKTINSGKADIKVYRRDIVKLADEISKLKTLAAQANMQTIWSNKGDHLMMFPTPLTMEINGIVEKQVTLLFMDESGCGKLIGIGEAGEPMLCKMPKTGLKPKAATLAKAGNILRQFKSQNWVITHEDLVAIQES